MHFQVEHMLHFLVVLVEEVQMVRLELQETLRVHHQVKEVMEDHLLEVLNMVLVEVVQEV